MTTMPRLSASRISRFSRAATNGLIFPSRREAVKAGLGVGPAGIRPLDVHAYDVDPVVGHVVEVANMALGNDFAKSALPQRKPHRSISCPPKYARSCLTSNSRVGASSAGTGPEDTKRSVMIATQFNRCMIGLRI